MIRVQNIKNYSSTDNNWSNDNYIKKKLNKDNGNDLDKLKENHNKVHGDSERGNNSIGHLTLEPALPIDIRDCDDNQGNLCNCECKCVVDKICGRKGMPDLGLMCQDWCKQRCARICDHDVNLRLQQLINRRTKVLHNLECHNKCRVDCQSTDGYLVTEATGIKLCRRSDNWAAGAEDAIVGRLLSDWDGEPVDTPEPVKAESSADDDVIEWKKNKFYIPGRYLSDSEDFDDSSPENEGFWFDEYESDIEGGSDNDYYFNSDGERIDMLKSFKNGTSGDITYSDSESTEDFEMISDSSEDFLVGSSHVDDPDDPINIAIRESAAYDVMNMKVRDEVLTHEELKKGKLGVRYITYTECVTCDCGITPQTVGKCGGRLLNINLQDGAYDNYNNAEIMKEVTHGLVDSKTLDKLFEYLHDDVVLRKGILSFLEKEKVKKTVYKSMGIETERNLLDDLTMHQPFWRTGESPDRYENNWESKDDGFERCLNCTNSRNCCVYKKYYTCTNGDTTTKNKASCKKKKQK